MDELTKIIGKRLKFIRHIFNEGGKLSVEQFAYILDETGDKMRNYELGRATLPNRVLYTLHYRGINSTFLITGEGEPFNLTPAGYKLKKIIKYKKINIQSMIDEIVNSKSNDKNDNINTNIKSIDIKKQNLITKVAAGNMKDI